MHDLKPEYFIDRKTTVWERFNYHDDKETFLKDLAALQENEQADLEFDLIEVETIFETSEYMHPEENGGCATIEAYERSLKVLDLPKQIWKNGN